MIEIARVTRSVPSAKPDELASSHAMPWINAPSTLSFPASSQFYSLRTTSVSTTPCRSNYFPTAKTAGNAAFWRFFQLSDPPTNSRTATDIVEPNLSTSILIAAYKIPGNLPFAETLRARLMTLVLSCLDNSEQEPLTPASLSDFLIFLEKTPGLRYPSIVATPTGNIRARWRESSSRHAALEFLGNGSVEFVVFAPDRKRAGQISRSTGITSSDSVLDILAPHRVQEWMTESDAA